MEIERIYPACRSILGQRGWAELTSHPDTQSKPETVPLLLAQMIGRRRIPPHIGDLAALEWAIYATKAKTWNAIEAMEDTIINPTLSLLTLRWKHLLNLLQSVTTGSLPPEPGEEHILVWKVPGTGEVQACTPTQEDLLVLKMVEERIESRTVASTGGLPLRSVHDAVDRAGAKGLVMLPPPRITRGSDFMAAAGRAYTDAHVFTLQWHLTQRCHLSCRHCYDRTDRQELPLGRSLDILDDFDRFCKAKRVRGAVTFTGGDPLLYPDFSTLYGAAADHGFATAILGNPTGRAVLEHLLTIAKPDFFQVSLEGLEEYNNCMRGKGHFKRTLIFLEVLRDLGIYSMVMLTLTEGNMKEVLPLARSLQGKTDVFHFNRLSRSGMGADLNLPSREEYRSFLKEYIAASRENSVMGLKDNLLNLVLVAQGEAPFGGCTGFGCGAAFNFVTLLPDGELHACRKFPSLIGNILQASFSEIYDSANAARYRQRPEACRGCDLRATCGGCLAVIQTNGLDISKERDPLCFR
jgi:selenobiotic family peptide radical SAM maturase